MIVATGSLGASALMSAWSIWGEPTFLKPRGTVPRILIGYVPFLLLRWRVYSHEENVRTMITKALRNAEMKKNVRAVWRR
jgi:hypothetical protein